MKEFIRTDIRLMTEYEYMVLSRMAARATYNIAHVRPEASAEERKALKEKASVLNAACHICAKYIKREADNGE